MAEMTPLQLLVSVNGIDPNMASQLNKYQKRSSGSGNVTVITVFGRLNEVKTEFVKSLENLRNSLLAGAENWLVVYQSDEHENIVSIIKGELRLGDIRELIGNEIQSVSFWKSALISDMRNLLSQDIGSEDEFEFRFWTAQSAFATNLPTERVIEVKQIISQFWEKDPAMKKILLHAYLLQSRKKMEAGGTLYPELKRRAGEEPHEFKTHIGVLQSQDIMEIDGTCILRTDNKAFESVRDLASNEYLIDQTIEGVSGGEFLSVSYGAEHGAPKKFSNAVKGLFRRNMPLLREIDLDGNPHLFEFFLPGKWFAVIFSQTRLTPLTETSVAMAFSHKERLNSWLVMRSSYAVVCGPSFSRQAIAQAEGTNVYLLDAPSLLKLNKYLSALDDQKRIAVHDYFPLLFSYGAGVVPIESAVNEIDAHLA